MNSRVLIGLVVGAVVATWLTAVAEPAYAQGGVAAQATPAAASANRVKRVPIAKSVFGDAGMIVNARDDGFIEIAAAGPKTVLIQLRAMAARAWVDSTSRMLRARPRRSNTPRTYRSDIDEHGTSITMALTRKVTAGESEYALFFSDDPLGGFTIPIEKSEADVFVAQIRRAVALSAKLIERPDSSAPRADSAAKKTTPKPAAKRAAKPPAAAPANTPATKTGTGTGAPATGNPPAAAPTSANPAPTKSAAPKSVPPKPATPKPQTPR